MFVTILANFIQKIIRLVIRRRNILKTNDQFSLIISIARHLYLNTKLFQKLLTQKFPIEDCDGYDNGFYLWDDLTEKTPYEEELTSDPTGILISINVCDNCFRTFQIAVSDMGDRIFIRWETDNDSKTFTTWLRIR